eukprot:12534433-Ditylum_brightwellii.AAC.1
MYGISIGCSISDDLVEEGMVTNDLFFPPLSAIVNSTSNVKVSFNIKNRGRGESFVEQVQQEDNNKDQQEDNNKVQQDKENNNIDDNKLFSLTDTHTIIHKTNLKKLQDEAHKYDNMMRSLE